MTKHAVLALFVAYGCSYLFSGHAVASPWNSDRIAVVVSESLDDTRIRHEIYQHFVIKGTRSKAVYAARHGYDMKIIVHSVQGGHMNWNKLYWTRRAFGVHCRNCTVDVPVCAKYDWVIWMDNDIFITNGTVSVQDLIEEGRRVHGGEYPHFIANRDNLGSLNTGVALIRCSPEGLHLLNYALDQRGTESVNEKVRMFDHNGAIWWAYDVQQWVRDITALIPAKLMNAYPWPASSTDMAPCPSDYVCGQGHWSPGDFLIHFAGDNKAFVPSFLRQFPPATWIGYEGELTYD